MNSGFIQGRNLKLFSYTNDIESEISVILLHGYAEHAGRYKRFLENLNSAGIRYLAFDQRGHGQSEGERVMVNSFDDFTSDLNQVVSSFFVPGKKNFIYAHSMGGLVLLRYLEQYGDEILTGVVTTGAALKPDDSIPKILIKLSTMVAKIFPRLPTIKLDGSAVSRDPEEVRKYNEDPLNYRGGTKAKFGYEFLKAMHLAKEDLSKITLPFFVQHGTKDRLIDPESAQWIYDGINSQDKQLKYWDGLFHELLNEPEKDQISSAIINWIKESS